MTAAEREDNEPLNQCLIYQIFSNHYFNNCSTSVASLRLSVEALLTAFAILISGSKVVIFKLTSKLFIIKVLENLLLQF